MIADILMMIIIVIMMVVIIMHFYGILCVILSDVSSVDSTANLSYKRPDLFQKSLSVGNSKTGLDE